MTDEGLEKLFHLMDTDHGGSVSFKELALALNQLGLGTPEQKLECNFPILNFQKFSIQKKTK